MKEDEKKVTKKKYKKGGKEREKENLRDDKS
jgi:hypothetical protein